MLICTILVGLIQNALSELKPSTIILETAGSSNVVIKFRCVLMIVYITKVLVLYILRVLRMYM